MHYMGKLAPVPQQTSHGLISYYTLHRVELEGLLVPLVQSIVSGAVGNICSTFDLENFHHKYGSILPLLPACLHQCFTNLEWLSSSAVLCIKILAIGTTTRICCPCITPLKDMSSARGDGARCLLTDYFACKRFTSYNDAGWLGTLYSCSQFAAMKTPKWRALL